MADTKATKKQIAELLAKGYTPRQIALALDLTTQRVYQRLEEIRQENEAEAPA